MTDQPSLFDQQTAAEEARDVAIEQAEAHANPVWLNQALWAVHAVAKDNVQFTTDDIWDRIPGTREPRALGAVMRQAVGRGWIVATDRTRKSRRVQCHARPVRVWQSLVRTDHQSTWTAA